MDQDPKPNMDVVEGSEINIIISDGKEEKFTKVPILLGRKIDEVKDALQKANLVLGNITYGYDKNYIEDVVILQDVAAGTIVKEGSVVSIVINKKELAPPNEEQQQESETQTQEQGLQENTTNQNNQ